MDRQAPVITDRSSPWARRQVARWTCAPARCVDPCWTRSLRQRPSECSAAESSEWETRLRLRQAPNRIGPPPTCPSGSKTGSRPRSQKPLPTAVSLFSGCGGSDTGLVAAGFDVLMANDCWSYAAEVYAANLPETDYRVAPIQELTSFPEADLLAGCYPCQGFSQGGARDAARSVNYLYREFERVLRAIRPKAFVVENVSGMRRKDFRHLLDDQIGRFTAAGYRVQWAVLNAAEYGVPQERRRIFLVGIQNDIPVQYTFPSPTHGPRGARPFVTIRDAIGGMPEWPEGEFFDDPFHWYYLSRNRRRDWGEVSKTIVSHPRHMPLHPMSPQLVRVGTDEWKWSSQARKRRFSCAEAARLQGFSPGFAVPATISLRARYRAVGNAVPPPLFEAVVRALPAIW